MKGRKALLQKQSGRIIQTETMILIIENLHIEHTRAEIDQLKEKVAYGDREKVIILQNHTRRRKGATAHLSGVIHHLREVIVLHVVAVEEAEVDIVVVVVEVQEEEEGGNIDETS